MPLSSQSRFDAALPKHITFCCGISWVAKKEKWTEMDAKNFLGMALGLHSFPGLLSDGCTYRMNPALSSAKEDSGNLWMWGNHQSLISSTRIKQTLIYDRRVCVINSNERRRESWGHFYEQTSITNPHPPLWFRKLTVSVGFRSLLNFNYRSQNSAEVFSTF